MGKSSTVALPLFPRIVEFLASLKIPDDGLAIDGSGGESSPSERMASRSGGCSDLRLRIRHSFTDRTVRLRLEPECRFSVRVFLPLAASQTTTAPSSEAVTTFDPSGVNSAAVTGDAMLNSWIFRPLARFHAAAEQSFDAVNNRLPDLSNATHVTQSTCAAIVRFFARFPMSHTLTLPWPPPNASDRPSGLNATAAHLSGEINLPQFPSTRDVPDDCRVIGADSDDPLAIGAVCRCCDIARVPVRHDQFGRRGFRADSLRGPLLGRNRGVGSTTDHRQRYKQHEASA